MTKQKIDYKNFEVIIFHNTNTIVKMTNELLKYIGLYEVLGNEELENNLNGAHYIDLKEIYIKLKKINEFLKKEEK